MEFVFGDPEEIAKMMDRQHMAQQVTQQEIDRLIKELPFEDLMTLRFIYRAAAQNPIAGGFFDGLIYGRLRSENRCVDCGGEPHDDLEKTVYDPASDETTESDTPEERVLVDGTDFTEEEHRNMAEYNLDDLRDEDSGALIGFICTKCGLRYVSIEDRMLRARDACHGCYLKSAHG